MIDTLITIVIYSREKNHAKHSGGPRHMQTSIIYELCISLQKERSLKFDKLV